MLHLCKFGENCGRQVLVDDPGSLYRVAVARAFSC
jgi:hypothetical protein